MAAQTAKRNTFNEDEELEERLDFKSLMRIFKYIGPYRKQMLKVLSIIFLGNIGLVIGPFLLRYAIDYSIPNQNYGQLIMLAAIFLAGLLVSGICTNLRINQITRLGQQILMDMREDIFVHLQKLSFNYFDSRPHGKILIRVVNYINSLSEILSSGLINLISDLLSLIMTFAFMLLMDARLAGISLALFPIVVLVTLLIKNSQRRAFQVLSNKQSNMNAYIAESIEGVKVTQSFAREEVNGEIFDDVNKQYRSSWMSAIKRLFIMHPVLNVISALTTALVIFVAIYFGHLNISAGVLIAFMGYLNNLWNPLINIGNFYNSLINASAYLERIFETLDTPLEISDVEHAKTMPSIVGNITFEDVTFAYDSSKTILENVNFEVKKGETIALVGPTGAGKSTIINLISRFYNLEKGRILVDGEDISQVSLASLRGQMGVMMQDTFIFSGTIKENILYGKLDATDEEVMAAAKAVMAHDFIMEMPNGYDTVVKERGSNLSAGQRQLISFARTLLRNPKILILDEATSSIDTKTEKDLQIALDKLLEGRTSFVIAHRLSTIKNASRIFYVSDKQIVESGSHDELLEEKGRYYELFNSQFNILDKLA
ncbi:MAG: ABC transporter ATP-binding protein/permease [Turicibacter sp.]|nr:ABC transporter ATP-binding protein/permease [Turicibacter sp.]